jgi:hypothetical protein
MGSQICFAQAAACQLNGMGDGLGNFTLVKRSLAAFCHPAQCSSQSWIAKYLTGPRAASVDS